MIPIDGDFILEVAPNFSGAKAAAQETIIKAISTDLANILDSFEINTYLRIAHFMGQVTHECAGFRTTEEFASGAAYEGRLDLGNNHKGDGKRYKGRGLLQLTGRANYRRVGGLLGVDLEGIPLLAGEPLMSLRIACEYWKDRKINVNCDDDDLIKVTRKVNGGLNGLSDRDEYLKKAKIALKKRMAIAISSQQGGVFTVLRRGSFGDAVTKLQEMLRQKGFMLAIDGNFGPATELAITKVQEAAGLEADGIVGKQTWAVLGGQ